MISLPSYTRIVRAGAWYDLAATIGFATPWSFAAVHESLVWITQTWQLPGVFPAFDPVHVLMANLLGSIVVIWAILRLRNPLPEFGRYSAMVRVLFIIWQLYAVAHGASVVILGFSVVLALFAIAESLPVKARHQAPDGTPNALKYAR